MDAQPSPLTLSWRVGVAHYVSDEAFERLLKLLGAYPDIVDEVALFETVTHHLYLPLEALRERAALIGRRLQALRERGVRSVGINVLTTIGHINEAWDTMPPLPFAPMVGHDGSVSRGCACPNTREFREYVRAKYTLFAEVGPDFVWVDDDIRMHNHGVACGCFCPTCLALLAESTGVEHTRESLVQAFDAPEGGALRAAWVEQNVRTVESVLADVAAAVGGAEWAAGPSGRGPDASHSAPPTAIPGIATGLMTAGPGWTTYSGQAFDRWFPALRASKARPGGGFYTDATPFEMVRKVLDVGRQCANLPATVPDRQYELENFPYQRLRKSRTALVSECTLALGMGLNGIAFNLLSMWGGHLDDCRPLLPAIREARPLWESLVAAADGLPVSGLWPAWSPLLMARRAVRPGEQWLAHDPRYDVTRPDILAAIGLPLSPLAPSLATVLSGRVAEAFPDEELTAMLAGGVLMDGEALLVLTERGLEHLAGVRLARRLDNGAMECFSDDPLNAPHAGEVRDARVEFWGDARGQADVLQPTATGVRVLAEIEDYFREPHGPCMTAYENELGGRVVVMGYAPWMFLQSVAKRAQLLNVADWIIPGALPVRIEEPVPLVPLVRASPERDRGVVVLLNAGLDPLEEATLLVRAPRAEEVTWLTPAGAITQAVEPDGAGWRLRVGPIAPWGVACLAWGAPGAPLGGHAMRR